jgi:methionyl-tRNA formyltransferase
MALAAFAALVPKSVLDLAPRGILNVHPSLLPRWRGAAPIQAALANGDVETGVSIIRLVEALDAGPIFNQQRVTIDPSDDYLSLEPRLARIGAVLLVQTLATWPEPTSQSADGVTFAPRIERDDARLDWSRSAQDIVNTVRAYRAWPQAFTVWNGKLLKVLRARAARLPDAAGTAPPGRVSRDGDDLVVATGDDGWLRLDEVQLEGKRAMSGAELARGYTDLIGADLA